MNVYGLGYRVGLSMIYDRFTFTSDMYYVTVRSSVHRCISAQRLLVITVLGITEQ